MPLCGVSHKELSAAMERERDVVSKPTRSEGEA